MEGNLLRHWTKVSRISYHTKSHKVVNNDRAFESYDSDFNSDLTKEK